MSYHFNHLVTTTVPTQSTLIQHHTCCYSFPHLLTFPSIYTRPFSTAILSARSISANNKAWNRLTNSPRPLLSSTSPSSVPSDRTETDHLAPSSRRWIQTDTLNANYQPRQQRPHHLTPTYRFPIQTDNKTFLHMYNVPLPCTSTRYRRSRRLQWWRAVIPPS